MLRILNRKMISAKTLTKFTSSFLVETKNPSLNLNSSINLRFYSLQNETLSYQFGIRTTNDSPKLSPLTIGQLLERSTERNAEKTAVIVQHQNITKTFRQFNEEVDKLAQSLYSVIGCRRGDTVGIWAVNSYEWLLLQFATSKIGSILICLNPAYKEQELLNCINLIKLKTLIMDQKFKSSNYCQIFENLSPGLLSNTRGHLVESKKIESLKNLIVIDNEEEIAPKNISRFSELMNKNSESGENFKNEANKTQFDDVINVQFTSGTTGLPKGAMLTHHNILQNCRFLGDVLHENFEDLVICVPNPLYHAFGSTGGSMVSVYTGGTIVLSGPIFNPQTALSAIEKYRCNFFYGTPTMWSDVLKQELGKYDLKSLKRGVMSGAPCPPALLKNAFKKIPSMENIFIPYGSTETGPVATTTTIVDSPKHKLESVGLPLPYVEVKVINPKTGDTLPRGEKGEILMRGHGVFPGYFNQPDKTKEAVDSTAWYHSGDIGYMDKEGYLFVSGRIKEMIIRGGENIYPREVEELILLNEMVEDVHVVGVPDERFGEELVAYIKLYDNFPRITETEMKNILKQKMSHFKVPKHMMIVDDFPRTTTGKVRKVDLKELAAKQFGEKQQTTPLK